jgi:hypothetical protein
MTDRRQSPRKRVDLLFNKYIDGYPHLCRTIDVSESGLLLERVNEPQVTRDFYPVEIGLMEVPAEGEEGSTPERVWLWAKQVWTDGARQALTFIGVEDRDRAKLNKLLTRAGYLEEAMAT